MEVQEILESKENLIKFLKDRDLQEEKDYTDDEFKEGTYFKIDKRKLLVVYEIVDEEKLKEVKDHFLIDRGLSYCVIVYNHKLIFFRNFGETKHFIYSERTKDNISKIDRLKKIAEEGFDFIFQAGKDISGEFYELFELKRNLLVQHIKNNVEPTEKYLIAQKIFDRFFFTYFLCHKGIIKFKDGGKISGENLFSRVLLKKGNFLDNLKKLFHLFNSQDKKILEIGEYKIVIPYLNGGLFRPDVLEQNLDISLKNVQWEEIFEFLNGYHWIIEDVKVTEENEERILTPEILGHVYERSVVEWEQKGFEEEAKEALKKMTERKKKGVYYTPESVTDYIANNTIIPYLLDRLSNKYESFEELIDSKDKKSFKEALKILDEIRVLDPACGSGAFLIKTSEVILGLKRRLNYELKEKKNFYDLKLDIITENIYGVDILAGAIEISKLRLWLWLISDFEESKNEINALPNIEYNLVVGNSLIGWADEKLTQISLANPMTDEIRGIFKGLIANSIYEKKKLQKAKELLEKNDLEGYIDAYYIIYTIYKNAHGERATDLREILQTIRKAIYKSINNSFLNYINKKIKPNHDTRKPPIDIKDFEKLNPLHWRVDFGHIIKRGGFDVVIENPPYISPKKVKEDNPIQIPVMNCIYYNEGLSQTCKFQDVYELFFYRSLRLVKNKQLFGLICSDSFLCTESFERLREFILSKTLIKWYPCPLDTFKTDADSPSVSTSIMIIKNDEAIEDVICYLRPKSIKDFSNEKFKLMNPDKFKKSIRKSFWIPTEENILIYERIISKIKIIPNIKLFEEFVEGYSRMETPNNSEFLAVLNEDERYSNHAKKYIQMYGPKINELSLNGELHGKVWKIIEKSQIKEISNLTESERNNGTKGEWIIFIKGSGVSALEANKRWKSKMHYYINWNKDAINNYNMAGKEHFWKKGIYWSLATESKESGFLINPDSRLKFALKEEGPNDVNYKAAVIDNNKYLYYLLGVLNTKLAFKIKFNFINSSTANQQCDINLIPIILPKAEELEFIEKRVKLCVKMQEEEMTDIKFDSKKYTLDVLEEEIEKKIREIYSIPVEDKNDTPEEIEIVEDFYEKK